MFNVTPAAIQTVNEILALSSEELTNLVSTHTLPPHPQCRPVPTPVGKINPTEISIINLAFEDKKIWNDKGQLDHIQPTITIKVQYREEDRGLYKTVSIDFDAKTGQRIGQ